MKRQLALLSLLVGTATLFQPAVLAGPGDACIQAGEKGCEVVDNAIAEDAAAIVDLESFSRVTEILDRDALAATPANGRTMFEPSSEDSLFICECIDSWDCPGGSYCSHDDLCMPWPGCGIGGWNICTGVCLYAEN